MNLIEFVPSTPPTCCESPKRKHFRPATLVKRFFFCDTVSTLKALLWNKPTSSTVLLATMPIYRWSTVNTRQHPRGSGNYYFSLHLAVLSYSLCKGSSRYETPAISCAFSKWVCVFSLFLMGLQYQRTYFMKNWHIKQFKNVNGKDFWKKTIIQMFSCVRCLGEMYFEQSSVK